MSKKSVAEIIVDTLVAAGVKRVFGVVGDSLNGITDDIRSRDNIEFIAVRHEEGGAFAAGAEAHLTGDLAVCAGSCGPGNTHLINGLFDCHRSRVPVLALAAQIPSVEIGTGYFQETHPERLFRECSHYCELISTPEQAVRTIESAVAAALGQRGVAVVVLPGDVAYLEAEAPKVLLPTLGRRSTLRPSDADIRQAAQVLNNGRKVTILAGIGCAGAHSELLQVAELLQAPVVHALRGKEHLEPNNPFDVGLSGLLGMPAGYHALMDADTLLMLGTDFPYRQFYPEDARVVQVDVRPENIGRRTRVEIGLVGDVADTLRQLLQYLVSHPDSSHLEAAQERHRDDDAHLAELATGDAGDTSLHPQHVARLLDELAAENAIFTCDVGTPTIWAGRYLHMNGQRRLLGSFVHGSMANAVSQAYGAALSDPGRQVIAMCGDGGLAMLLSELLTIRQHKIPVKIIVFNNSALSFVELEMKAAGILEYGTELDNPDFGAVAEAAGLKGFRVSDPANLESVLRQALAHDGPALVDAVVKRQELSMPPSIEPKQAKGFGLYALKALMNGKGSELLELAKTNLFR
ncbi:ubiquinone-dependent pyruvate dehydrogenase [Hymenobacter properus]|uniref:Pyruvate dehydrogenase [ubiquinone] n=1 Tax=Hymenobacter properus TaxID=2791026 RepID=A0A931BMA9_9BACT|nr:ubiquinone-dependent pyruvate dehydrogenase [Hymenobacter properus]MBF9142060.1 ubiquinone-dependent pyruvate dehydrogenase [Hymenobacter properus]MBR7720867.1 ubiquinone-dependent pyruvate dehydrogenase [Microvirga sp. SRT04]